METDKKQTNSIDNLKDLAVERLTDYFEKTKEVKEDEAKMALGALSAVSRLLATYRVRDATQFSIIKTLTSDPKAREEYVRATLPGYCPPKILEQKTEE